jgi:hypothetical protein
LNLSRPLLSDVFHFALKEISQLLHGGTKPDPEAEFGEIDCRPRPFLQDVHGSLHRGFPLIKWRLLYATSQGVVLLLRAKTLFAAAILKYGMSERRDA